MEIDRAARAIRDGELVVYPTETVYGLGADALSPAAVERVYEAKGRNRSKPLSMAVPDVESAVRYADLTGRDRRFIEEFLPGPATAIVAAGPDVPEELTAGRDRVGIRIPDHERALALLEETAPITATSANVSGRPSVRRADALDPEIREAAACVLDGAETGGTESTVVDVERGVIHRRGTLAEGIEDWLEAQ